MAQMHNSCTKLICNVPHKLTAGAGANETGYLVSGEAWVQNKKLSFSCKVITSHIDAATGEKIADDEILIQSKVSSDDTYKTSPLSGRTDVIAPVNASGNLSSGIINVVYLYTSSERPSTAPSTVTPTTTPLHSRRKNPYR